MEKEELILSEIAYEQRDGLHTFTMCSCGRMGCRGSKCTLCLTEELNQIRKDGEE
jgi:hypothetical protein